MPSNKPPTAAAPTSAAPAANAAPVAAAASLTSAALAQAQSALALGNGALATRVLQEALVAHPEQAALHVGLGVALRFVGQLEEAAKAFAQALVLQPANAQAAVYLAMIYLAQGKQQQGWQLYEARWLCAQWPEKMRFPLAARWTGKLAAGQRLLLWGEQGFGDVIQFARYVPWLAQQVQAQGAALILEVPPPLQRLFQTSWPSVPVAARGELQGHFDAHLPLLDLPRIWGNTVGADGLPYLPQAYLVAQPSASVASQPSPSPSSATAALNTVRSNAPQPATLRVGIAWQGRPSHPDDRLRSIPVQALEVLSKLPGIQWVSLQKEATPQPAWMVQDIHACLDFADTAALVAPLDLVISIDSAVAHLAGALGRPVWLLLPKIADWRWGLEGDSTPWYPSMRIWRRSAQDDWPALLVSVAAALAQSTDAAH